MNDVGQFLSWRGLLRIVPLYFVLMGLYNYGLGVQNRSWTEWFISTLTMTVVLSAATLVILYVIMISNRGGIEAFQAQRLSKSGDRAGAIQKYSDAIKRNPDLAEALVGRAELLVQGGQNPQARADLDHAIEVTPHVVNFGNPLLFRAYIERGRLRDLGGDRRGAAEDWRQATRSSPGSPDPYILRGRAALEQGDWLNGRRLLQQGIQLLSHQLKRTDTAANQNRAAQLNMRGLAYNLLGEYRPAMADLEQALALEPNSWVAHFNLGATYLNMGFIDQALSELSSAIKLNPSAAQAARASRAYATLAGNPAFEAVATGRPAESLAL